MKLHRPEDKPPSRAGVARMVLGVVGFAAADGLIVWAMVDQLWGEPLLSTIGSRNRHVWASWIVLCVLLVISSAFLLVCLSSLLRALRDRIQRAPKGDH